LRKVKPKASLANIEAFALSYEVTWIWLSTTREVNLICPFLGNKNQCRRNLSREKFLRKEVKGEILPKFPLGTCQSPKPLAYIL